MEKQDLFDLIEIHFDEVLDKSSHQGQELRRQFDMFKNRKIKKEYITLVKGHPEKTGTISSPIVRHPADPRKMMCNYVDGREAQTNYKVERYFDECALITVYPLTGRTHQIRVHFAAIGHPVLGDSLYGTSSKLIKRQALHAHKLSFDFEGKFFEFTSPIPEDMKKLIDS